MREVLIEKATVISKILATQSTMGKETGSIQFKFLYNAMYHHSRENVYKVNDPMSTPGEQGENIPLDSVRCASNFYL